MLAVVAHDLRQPASAALMAADFLEELLDVSASAEVVRQQLALIRRCMRHALQLTEDLLTVGQLDEGALQLRCAPFECEALLHEVRALIGGAARLKQVQVCVHPDGAPFHLMADRQRLRQVLSNLCDNAVKITPAGGRIILSVTVADDSVSFAVSDSGPGMSDAALSRAFDQYWQADQARTAGSVGLGLSIARWLVQLHGGSIRAYNAAGGGLTVAFSIPVGRGARGAQELLPIEAR